MVKKGGLGRGINSFIKDTNAVERLLRQDDEKELKSILIDDIVANEKQARKKFNEEALNELAKSIEEFGIIQPIVLRKTQDKYMIIAGERRYRAAKIAGLKEVPAVIKEISEQEADKISLIENVQRIDLNPIEEAIGYKNVIEQYNLTQEELAQALGKSRQYIGNTIRLLKLDERVMDFVYKGLLTPSHAKLLLAIKDKNQQYKEAKRIVRLGNTVKETTLIFKSPATVPKDIYKEQAIRDLSNLLGTKVSLKGKGKVKKIEIEYYSDEDLSRICEAILGSDE